MAQGAHPLAPLASVCGNPPFPLAAVQGTPSAPHDELGHLLAGNKVVHDEAQGEDDGVDPCMAKAADHKGFFSFTQVLSASRQVSCSNTVCDVPLQLVRSERYTAPCRWRLQAIQRGSIQEQGLTWPLTEVIVVVTKQGVVCHPAA